MNTNQEWRAIVGFEGRYEVSDLGVVRGLTRISPRSDGRFITKIGRDLKGTIGHNGYPVVSLDSTKRQYIHRLVAIAFIPNRDSQPIVNHLNGDKTDNRAVNLEWSTLAANAEHARATGLNNQHGENCNLTKYSSLVIEATKDLWVTGKYSQNEIGLVVGMSGIHVGEIARGTSRKSG